MVSLSRHISDTGFPEDSFATGRHRQLILSHRGITFALVSVILTIPFHSDFHVPERETHLVGRDTLDRVDGLEWINNDTVYFLLTLVNL